MSEGSTSTNTSEKKPNKHWKRYEIANEAGGALGSAMGAADSFVDLSDASDEAKANVSIASGTINLGTGAMGAVQAGKNLKDAKNGKDKAKGILDMTSSLSNIGGGAASIAKGGLKKSGNEEGAGAAEKAGGFFGLLGGLTGTASSSMDIHEARTKKNEEIEKKIREINADPSITDKEAAIKEAKKEIDKKYSGDLFSGSMGIIGNLLGAGGGLASMIGGATGQLLGGILGGAGSIFSMLGSLGSMGGKIKELNEDEEDDAAESSNDSGDTANDTAQDAAESTQTAEGETESDFAADMQELFKEERATA